MIIPSLDFGDDIAMLRDSVRVFAKAEIEPRAAQIDRDNKFPADLWRKFGDLGLLGMTVSEEDGGTNMGYLAHIVALEELSRASASVSGGVGEFRMNRRGSIGLVWFGILGFSFTASVPHLRLDALQSHSRLLAHKVLAIPAKGNDFIYSSENLHGAIKDTLTPTVSLWRLSAGSVGIPPKIPPVLVPRQNRWVDAINFFLGSYEVEPVIFEVAQIPEIGFNITAHLCRFRHQ
jgi:hypothetical protein